MKQILVYNTLSGKKELFREIEPGKVKMYVCGITPYDECHLGHARCYVVFDTVRRYLRHAGYAVTYVQNFTDVDDKIISRSRHLGEDAAVLAGRYIENYYLYMGKLNVLSADVYPRVTQNVPEIVALVERLIKQGHAYVIGSGDVFYAVDTFPEYGKLSKRNTNDMLAGARVEVNENKRSPLDFALWKAAKPGEISWDSPWGQGRPGWHIECSAMSMKHLGVTFDIHGGGADLIFPHHENEIAQSEGATGKPFAAYWLHNGFVTINHEKMSKSLGNFFTLREVFEKYTPASVRLFLLSRHYRSPLDFSDVELGQASRAWSDLCDTWELAHFVLWKRNNSENYTVESRAGISAPDIKPFEEALADDFNTEKAIGQWHILRTRLLENAYTETKVDWFIKALNVYKYVSETLLGLPLPEPVYREALPHVALESLKEREEARKKKDWSRADSIRRELTEQGYYVDDTPLGPRLKRL